MMTNTVAHSVTRIIGTPMELGGIQATLVYRLKKPFAVVQFQDAGKGRIVFLPKKAELRVVGPSCMAGCFEVLYEERLYNIFKIDLLGPWSTPVRRGRIEPIRTLAAAAAACT